MGSINPAMILRRRGAVAFSTRLPILWWLLLVLGLLTFAFSASTYHLFIGSTLIVYAIAAIGQDWVIGRTGQVSLGGAALLAVGAFTTSLSGGTPLDNFPIPLILSGLVGAAVGVIVGLPALRLGGLYLLLSTLALQFIVEFIGNRYQTYRPAALVPGPLHIGSLEIPPGRPMFLLLVVLLILCGVFLTNVYRRAPGQIWASISESPLAAATMGVSLTRWKLLAFVGSSAMTAVAGSMFAYVAGSVSYETFSLSLALSLVVMVFVGGPGTVIGPIIGAILVTLLPVWLLNLSQRLPTGSPIANWLSTNVALLITGIYGLALLLVLLYAPGGLVRQAPRIRKWAIRVWARKKTARAMDGGETLQIGTNPATVRSADRVDGVADPAAGAAERPPLLSVSDLIVTYPNGAIGANGLSFTVPQGCVVALVGRNGAGKTSAVRAVAGYLGSERVKVDGAIIFDGENVKGLSPSARARLGITLVPERDKVFPSLTVAQHLRAVGISRAGVSDVLQRFPILVPHINSAAGLLSGGQRQLLALAVAVARRSRLLVIDEMSLGLAPIAVQSLIENLRAVRDEEGTTILLVDQATTAVAAVADYVYVVENGMIAAHGSSADLDEGSVRAAIIGVN